ncbi:MAG: AraC family transcriptional regulator [Caulobacteraceae bacterium]|nr:AraC family transcriptional regulator [Caulobacteraceae bacterium]
MAASPSNLVPVFQLYGEVETARWPEAEAGFVHLETIRARAGLHNWEIRPHRHVDLHQCLLILKGRGRFTVDGAEQPVAAPAVLSVPPTLIHAFAFEPDTEGYVLTVSDTFLSRALEGEPGLLSICGGPVAVSVKSERDLASLASAFEAVDYELHWPRPGRARAIVAYLNLILIAADRLVAEGQRQVGAPAREAALLDALRGLIHRHALENWGVEDYARALCVTSGRLTAACRRIAGRSPMQLVHDRLMIEAKRNLIYTCMSVQEISYALGFADPAYFSRFFSRRQGVSPQRFRQGQQAQPSQV